MDKSLEIWGMIAFIEKRVKETVDYSEMEEAMGFSLAYIREYFRTHTGTSLSRYILERKVAHAAFALVHTDQNVLDISLDYAFQNPDTFTRAFKRCTGRTPKEFRKSGAVVGKRRLCTGIYGIEIQEEHRSMKTEQESDGTVLYGVPKVGYGAYDSCTPLAICMKALAAYAGRKIEIVDLMVGSGAAFRLTWNQNQWDGGNVDVSHTFDHPDAVYEKAARTAGYECRILNRTDDMDKECFKSIIREQIDSGQPCLMTGVIGPPELCVITGYIDGGDTLYGWNFFQDAGEFAVTLEYDRCGYFICRDWWENPYTDRIFEMKPLEPEVLIPEQVIRSAAEVLKGRTSGEYAKGIMAYDSWQEALRKKEAFHERQPLAMMAEVMMCQGDAMDCLAEGRYSAREYFARAAGEESERRALLEQIAAAFGEVRLATDDMAAVFGGFDQRGETQMRMLMERETREKLCRCIDQARAADEKALLLMEEYLCRI